MDTSQAPPPFCSHLCPTASPSQRKAHRLLESKGPLTHGLVLVDASESPIPSLRKLPPPKMNDPSLVLPLSSPTIAFLSFCPHLRVRFRATLLQNAWWASDHNGREFHAHCRSIMSSSPTGGTSNYRISKRTWKQRRANWPHQQIGYFTCFQNQVSSPCRALKKQGPS